MDYRHTLEDAQKRLQVLTEQRDAIDREIQGLLRIIEGAQIISSPPEPTDVPAIPEAADADPAGFTKTIRLILARSSTPLVPTEIRDSLEILGIEASSPKVLLIHVHNTLRRLFEKGEIEQVPREGKMAYRMLTAADVFARTMRQHPLIALLSTGSRPSSSPIPDIPPQKNAKKSEQKD
jgi:hypothetical protein